MTSFAHAGTGERGCGKRKPGLYVELGLSASGMPVEFFLMDPPLPPPDRSVLDLVNKPQVWEGPSGLNHLLIWIGEEHYPTCPDFIEETRHLGISRRLSPEIDLQRLTRDSRMVLIHPRALNTWWQDQLPPDVCTKQVKGHDSKHDELNTGPCLFKLWHLIPKAENPEHILDVPGEPLTCMRHIGSTSYMYQPTGEKPDGLKPGIFGMFPISGFSLVRDGDGEVSPSLERARRKIEESRIPYDEVDE